MWRVSCSYATGLAWHVHCYQPILGSKGTLPRKATSRSAAILAAPPVVGGNIWVSFWKKHFRLSTALEELGFKNDYCVIIVWESPLTWHLGQTNPLMFSTTPIMGSLTLRQKLISFRTSCSETSWEVQSISTHQSIKFLLFMHMRRLNALK